MLRRTGKLEGKVLRQAPIHSRFSSGCPVAKRRWNTVGRLSRTLSNIRTNSHLPGCQCGSIQKCVHNWRMPWSGQILAAISRRSFRALYAELGLLWFSASSL